MWEKKLRDIEHHKYDAATFINELKEQVSRIVTDVLHDNSGRSIESGDTPSAPKPKGPSSAAGEKSKSASPKSERAPRRRRR